MTGQLSTVSTLPGHKVKNTRKIKHTPTTKHPQHSNSSQRMKSPTQMLQALPSHSWYTPALQYYLYSAVTYASHMSKTRDSHHPKLSTHS